MSPVKSNNKSLLKIALNHSSNDFSQKSSRKPTYKYLNIQLQDWQEKTIDKRNMAYDKNLQLKYELQSKTTDN